MSELLRIIISGVAQGIPLFLVASGLTLIYGVIGVLNFAHGAFFMIGAFMTYTLFGGAVPGAWAFLGAIVVGGVTVTLLGMASELGVVRRLYSADHVTMLLGTYALLLVLEGVAGVIWGKTPRTQRQPDALAGSIGIGGTRVAIYDLILLGVGVLVAVALWFLVNHTRFGQSVRAIAQDPTMAQAIGLNSKRVLLTVFALGSLLAGVAGALYAPLVAITPSLGDGFILESFAVVIIGGLGSIQGSLVAALLVGLADSFSLSYLPALTGFTLYILVAIVLLVRPQGLLGNIRMAGAHA